MIIDPPPVIKQAPQPKPVAEPFPKPFSKEELPDPESLKENGFKEEPLVPEGPEEIGSLIRSATTQAKNSPPAPPKIRNGFVPGAQVKGIIFFDEGSSSNHIIVTTPDRSNLKLRMGDSVQTVVLKSIYPNRVVFSCQNEPIEMGIGQ